ncbi:MAG: hypothetical protein ACRDPY_05895 [Streptosporangiaceae bacterium]
MLSSHLVADLERICDYLVVLAASRVQVAGEIEGLLAAHHRLTGSRLGARALPAGRPARRSSRPATPASTARSSSVPMTWSSTRHGPPCRSAWKTWYSPT